MPGPPVAAPSSSGSTADQAIAAGYAGIQVRSYATGAGVADLNLVLWKWGDNLPARVILIDDEGRLSRGPA